MLDLRRRSLVAALVVLAAAASAQPAPRGVPVDSLARSFAAEHGLPSLVVGVVADGRRYVVGIGEVAGEAPGAHTLYEIGSVSKVLTSLALADAVVRGEVALDTPVADLLDTPVGAHPDGPIRLVDLATHTSGLPPLADNWTTDIDLADPYAAYSPDLLAAFLRDVEPAPGGAYGYSNAGAGLLGYALAQRAGTDYAGLVTERVLAPLGLADTWLVVPDSAAGRLAVAHGPAGTAVPWWTWTEPTAGAGGWRSSATDLLTLAEAVLSPDATPLAEALALATEPHAEIGSGQQVGLGWHLAPTPAGPMVWHNGMVGGSVSFVGVVPSAGVAVVVLANRQSSVDALGGGLAVRLATGG